MKKFDMKKVCLAASLALFAACGDDVTNDSVVKAESYESKADLPECDDASSGLFATVPSKKEVYFCADNAWKSVRSEAASLVDNGKFICSTEELDNSSGYKVVCGGDSVGVVLNGKKGDKGADAEDGDKGKQGEPGADGSGSNGKDLTLGENDCAVLNEGLDFVIYDCGDSVYVKDLSGNKANFKTWNALRARPTVTQLSETSFLSSTIQAIYWSATGSSKDAQLERWDGDTWSESPSPVTDVTVAELSRNLAIRGKASLTVNKEANKYGSVPVEPMIGVKVQWLSAKDIRDWGGFCLTYDAKKDMELIVSTGSPYKVARTTIKASTKETTVDIPVNAFVPDDAEADLEDIVTNTLYTIVKVVGSLDEGKYENEYAIYELGAYGKCTGFTYNVAKAKVKALNPQRGSFKDPRDKKTYKTVTIGDQTWFAENLDYDYKVLVDPDDESAGYVEELVYEYADPNDKVKYGGRLYNWLAAIDYYSLANATPSTSCAVDALCSPALPKKVQGICPDGWHLPSFEEAETLFNAVADYNSYPLAAVLSLSDTKTFCTDEEITSSKCPEGNWLGFSATAGGSYKWGTGTGTGELQKGTRFKFVTSSENGAETYHGIWIFNDTGRFYTSPGEKQKTSGVAIRCIKDNEED